MQTPFTVIDLTHTLHETIPTWTNECGFYSKTTDYPAELDRIRAMEYSLKASAGTHIDAPLHFLENGISVDQLPVHDLVAPLCVIDVSDKIASDLFVTLDDVKAFENKYGTIKAGDFVAFCTGWSKYWNDSKLYRNADASGKMHFPGVTAEAAQYLCNKNIIGIGVDTLSPDGSHESFPVHHVILGASKYIVENLTNLEMMPPAGAYCVIAPLKVQGGAEAPARVLGLISTGSEKRDFNYTIREVKPADYPQINQLYIDTIHSVNAKDYTQQQRDVWAPKDQPATNWQNNFVNHYVLVAENNGLIVGFGDITSEDGYLDHLFIHKDYQGKGIASALVEKLEAYARGLGLKEMYTEASITAKPFFEKKGFTVTRKQDKEYKGVTFINYVMHKKLG